MKMTTEIFSTAGMNVNSETQVSKKQIFYNSISNSKSSFQSAGRNKPHIQKVNVRISQSWFSSISQDIILVSYSVPRPFHHQSAAPCWIINHPQLPGFFSSCASLHTAHSIENGFLRLTMVPPRSYYFLNNAFQKQDMGPLCSVDPQASFLHFPFLSSPAETSHFPSCSRCLEQIQPGWVRSCRRELRRGSSEKMRYELRSEG